MMKEPYGQEDHDLGVNYQEFKNPVSRGWKRAATWSVPNATWYPQTPQTPGAYPRDERGVSGDWRVAPMDKTRYLPLAPPDLERSGYIEGLLDGHVRQEEADSGLPLSAAEEGSRCAEPAPERMKAREERGLLQKPPKE